MPTDNPDPIAAGEAIALPENGVISGDIAREDASGFNLLEPGTYLVSFTLPLAEAGEVVLTLNGDELPYTAAVGAAAGQLSGTAIVNTTLATSTLRLINPTGGTAFSLGTGTALPASAHLTILRLA